MFTRTVSVLLLLLNKTNMTKQAFYGVRNYALKLELESYYDWICMIMSLGSWAKT